MPETLRSRDKTCIDRDWSHRSQEGERRASKACDKPVEARYRAQMHMCLKLLPALGEAFRKADWDRDDQS
jgi:hypothetical protein